jgi:hypothetical protein
LVAVTVAEPDEDGNATAARVPAVEAVTFSASEENVSPVAVGTPIVPFASAPPRNRTTSPGCHETAAAVDFDAPVVVQDETSW